MLKWILIAICLCSCAAKQRYIRTQQQFTNGAVAADHVLASEVGVEILRNGGNAVDAAVATSFVLSVVRPESCGIGGGGFMMIDSPTMEPVALNYRETAPESVGPDCYKTHESQNGPTAVGIPGTVAGLLEAHNRYGVLSRAEVLAPAIRLAGERSLRQQQQFKSEEETWSELRELVLPEQIRPFYDGSANQTSVLKLIVVQGKAGFYQGEVADAIEKATHGHITLKDLKNYSPRWEEPLRIDIGDGNTLVAMPPPSSGGVAIGQIIGLLQRVHHESLRKNDKKYAHALVESMKHAFADRAEHMADAAYVDVPVQALLDPAYLDELASKINLHETQEIFSYGSITPPPDDDGTSHLCVVDKNGMMVSATETINTRFGSHVYVEPFGFMLNNEMDDFSSLTGANVYGLRQSDKNLPEPGKRPLSSMSPTIIEHDGVPILALGGSGGPRIISSVVQVLLRILWFGDEPIEAVQRMRIHHQWLPNRVYLEDRTWKRYIELHLKGIGHTVWIHHWPDKSLGVVQVIQLEDGVIKPASDPRKGGKSAGF